jgi:hypothetical protein
MLLKRVVVQLAKSSASRRRNASQHTSSMHHNNDASTHRPPHGGEKPAEDRGKAASIHQSAYDSGRAIWAPVHGRLGNNRDVCDTVNACKRGREEQRRGAGHRYNPYHGSRYDSDGD